MIHLNGHVCPWASGGIFRLAGGRKCHCLIGACVGSYTWTELRVIRIRANVAEIVSIASTVRDVNTEGQI